MEAANRRERIMEILEQSAKPVSASKLAEQLRVSRQIIVGDVAILRAGGCDILATARGYVMPQRASMGRYQGKLACQHSVAETVNELYAIVDLGGEVLDVIVSHHLYGEISGQLNLSCRADVDQFLRQVAQGDARLLSELTGGVHLHTVSCRNEAVFIQIRNALRQNGFLYED